jgi:hypothetical protein
MLYVGIDPGLSGAVAVLTSRGRVVVLGNTPVIKVKKGKGSKRVYCAEKMADILRALPLNRVAIVGIESVHAMPHQGVTSMFSMGRGVGTWDGIIATLGLPIEWLSPQAWQKTVIGPKLDKTQDSKNRSIQRARELFRAQPDILAQLQTKTSDGRADALLIAEYMRRTYTARINVA